MTNRLVSSASPYLRQHKDNPVSWFEWGADAFAEAKQRNVPILLSVGYSACHWCHVMAHECFEDDDVASVMNAQFVNIKVDREERPDVDAIYMDAVQAMTGRGGWPMTVFLTPDGEPFYGGTYFPKNTFLQLMAAIDDVWHNKPEDVRHNVDALLDSLRRTESIKPTTDDKPREALSLAVQTLLSNFDSEWGGFGSAPKFPSTFALDLLMRAYLELSAQPPTQQKSSTAQQARDIETAVCTTLRAMAAGGMHDHLGGGFSRYSVDEKWLVPHFEKMLYDQALLLRVYVHAWQVFKINDFRYVAEELVTYVLRDLRHGDGGFYSAEDADSLDQEGHSHEGTFYTWIATEIADVLGSDAPQACAWWDITSVGNFEGRSIPNRIAHRNEPLLPDNLARSRTALFAARATRPRPGLDDKVLTEWNAMMLSSLCEAAAAFNRDDWRDAAVENGEFLVASLRTNDGRWHRSWQADATPQARHDALAHDLAQVVDAFTRLYELTGQARWINVAIEVADRLIDDFWDEENGGLFTTSKHAESLIVRAKDIMDNATASAQSTAAIAFVRLGALSGRMDLLERADALIALCSSTFRRAPSAFCNLALAMHLRVIGTTEIAITGSRSDLLDEVRSTWRPTAVVAWGERFDSPLWHGRDGERAYVCRDHVCNAPVSDREALREVLATTYPNG
ncbi:MAG: thioredoxin domain-containing protein [Actinobacteria bacterium]|nr:thioredoxin domain-containing protein [Actinomycetota bacterium]